MDKSNDDNRIIPQKYKYYRNKYFIVFYDKEDERLLYMFDNVREILQFQKKPLTKRNIRLINLNLYRGLKQEDHLVKFLTGQLMKVYIIDIEDE